jgi:hypothetical protein
MLPAHSNDKCHRLVIALPSFAAISARLEKAFMQRESGFYVRISKDFLASAVEIRQPLRQ